MPRDERRPPRRSARTWMLLRAPLGWLGGFPLAVEGEGVRWWTPPGAIPVALIGRRELRRASRALTELRGELRDTLDEAVPEPERWLGAVAATLHALGRSVHHGEPLRLEASDEPRELRARHPRLAPLLDAAAWSVAAAPANAKRVWRWIAERAASLEALFAPGPRARFGDPLGFAMTLVLGAAPDQIRAADAFLEAAAHPNLDAAGLPRVAFAYLKNLLPRTASLKALRKGTLEPVPAKALVHSSLASFVAEWAVWDAPRRRRAARLWQQAFDPALCDRWQRWWRELEELVDRVHVYRGAHSVPEAAVKALGRRLEERISGDRRPPPEYAADSVLASICELSQPERSGLATAVTRALDALPETRDGVPTRPAFLYAWSSLADDHEVRAVERHVDRVRRLLTAGGPAALAPWKKFLAKVRDGDYPGWTVDDLLLEWRGPAPDPSAPRLVRAAVSLDALPADQTLPAFLLCLAGAPAELAREVLARVDREDALPLGWYHLRWVADALALTDEPAELARILVRMTRLGDAEPFDLVFAGARVLAATHRQAAADLVAGDPAVAADLGRRRLLLQSLGDAEAIELPLVAGGDRGWIDDYPEALATDLDALADVDPDARETAGRLLRRDLRSRESLERELAALRGRDDDPGLARRRDNLEARLRSPQAPPPRVLARLAAKLRRAAAGALVDGWRKVLDQRVLAALGSTLAAGRSAAEGVSLSALLEPAALVVAQAVAQLDDRAARRLGLELLARRCGPPPWDLHDHPANRAFVERLERAGADLRPWIGEPFGRELRGANGRLVTVELERDPLEVMRMGAPFGTCLSPWDFNFYSAVVNAVDVNKQVAYARDAEGRIVGRCLLALGRRSGDEDVLVAFHPYCHDPDLKFGEVMARFAGELAGRIGVELAAHARVAPLACPKWYDDGPHDLRGDLAFLAKGSPFLESLAALEPAALPSALTAACAPLAVSAHQVAALLPELNERPELVVGLEPWIERLRLPAIDRLRAAALARRAGRVDLARRWLGLCAGHLRGNVAIPWWDRPLGETLAELTPSLTLRLLVESRERRVRRWSDEWDLNRLWIAALAHLALHRKRKALELLRRAGSPTLHGPPEIRAKARRAAKRLAE